MYYFHYRIKPRYNKAVEGYITRERKKHFPPSNQVNVHASFTGSCAQLCQNKNKKQGCFPALLNILRGAVELHTSSQQNCVAPKLETKVETERDDVKTAATR